MSSPHLAPVVDDVTRKAARELIEEYLRWVAGIAKEQYGLSFDVDAMLESDINDRSKFYPPEGRMYLVRYDGAYAGVGCLKRFAPDVAEIQRMYVKPGARGLGAGRLLARRLIDDAKELGYKTIRLESLKLLSEAHTLYRSLGFVEIPPYTGSSMEEYQPADTLARFRASVLFMELLV